MEFILFGSCPGGQTAEGEAVFSMWWKLFQPNYSGYSESRGEEPDVNLCPATFEMRIGFVSDLRHILDKSINNKLLPMMNWVVLPEFLNDDCQI